VTASTGETTTWPVAVTGAAVLTPLGDTLDGLAAALAAGRSAVEPAQELGGAGLAAIADFEATRYANVRGLRLYNRPTRLGICAAKLALADSGVDAAGLPKEEVGVVLASTFGHLETLIEYDRSLVTVGLQRTNPALMPLAIPSAPGAAIALAFAAKAFSVTLSDSGVSSLDALALGSRLVAAGRARACVVVAVFSAAKELALAASRAGMLAPAAALRVFDRRRCGTALGEAAAAVVLERVEDARARGSAPRAFLRGQQSTFAIEPRGIERAVWRACQGALRRSELSGAEVGLVSSGASGSPQGDAAEARGLAGALGDAAPRTPVMAVKGNLGDTMDASGLLQALSAIAAMRSGRAPPILGLEDPEVPGLGYLKEEANVDARHALITSVSPDGACSALVLSAGHGA